MIIRVVCFLLCVFSLNNLKAQDTELWSAIELRHKLSKDLRVDLSEGLRLNQNISQYKSNLLELGLRYRITKWVSVRGAYRYVINDAERKNAQRLSTAFFFKKKANRFYFNLRSKYQYDFRFQLNRGSALVRNKLNIKYDKKKFPWTPSIFGEVFNPMTDIGNVNQWRLGAGLSYDIGKRKSIGAKYFYNQKRGGDSITNRNVIGLGFSWELK